MAASVNVNKGNIVNQDFHCRICGHVGHDVIALKERQFGSGEEFEYARCHKCGCLQIIDIPADLSRLYPSNYYSFNQEFRSGAQNAFIRTMQRLRVQQRLFGHPNWAEALFWRFAPLPWAWNRIRPYLESSRLQKGIQTRFLDVGCGNRSWWLESLQLLGFNHLEGVDPFIAQSTVTKRIKYHKAKIEELHDRYDFISMHHSLEHIPDPVSTLRAVAKHLRHDGTVLIRIPVFPNAVWEEYGDCCMSLDPPRHLYIHSIESISKVAADAGFEIIKHIYDTDETNFVSSEEYRLGLVHYGPGTYFRHPENSLITHTQVAAWRIRAQEVNTNGTADQAAFILKLAKSYDANGC